MKVFGKVAKGVGGAVWGPDRGTGAEDIEVEKFLGRVSDGLLPEDRRQALVQLKDLLQDNSQAQAAVGQSGIPVLCNILKNDSTETELLRETLECLVATLGSPAAALAGPQQALLMMLRSQSQFSISATASAPVASGPGAINCELFAKGEGNVALLLGLLAQEDFYVRYNTLQLLTALAVGGSFRLQQAVLGAPLGVVRLMDMVSDGREAIRNEALLLLVGLTRSNPDIQKIAAFEGAFDRLLSIITEEGGTDGDIIVQDCLELLNNTLRNAPGNQLMFREMGHLGTAVALLQVKPGGRSHNLPRQKAANLLRALDTLHLLLGAPHPLASSSSSSPSKEKDAKAAGQARAANQKALLAKGVLDALMALSLAEGGVSSQPVRCQALRCVADLCTDSPPAQQALLSCSITLGGSHTPALHVAIHFALHSPDAVERAAAVCVVRAFGAANPAGATALLTSLTPGKGPVSGDLPQGFIGSNHSLAGRAAGLLRSLLHGHASAKQTALTLSVNPPLLQRCSTALLSAASSNLQAGMGSEQRAVVGLLRLLIAWLWDFTAAVSAVLAQPSALLTIADFAATQFDKHHGEIAGCACVLLGVCLLHTDQAGAMPPTKVLEAISRSIGIGPFLRCLTALPVLASAQATAATPTAPDSPTRAQASATGDAREASGETSSQEEAPFDAAFLQWLPQLIADVQHRITALETHGHPTSAPSSPSTHVQLPATPPPQHAMTQQRTAQQMVSQQPSTTHPHSASQPAAADEHLQEANAKILTLTRELEQVRAQNKLLSERPIPTQAPGPSPLTAASITRLQAEVQQLMGKLTAAETALQDTRTELVEAQKATAKAESDVEGLGDAYNALESSNYQLEAQLNELRLSSTNAGGSHGAKSSVSEEEIERRVAEAVTEAQADSDEAMSDLLVCLGQEERKVAALSTKLQQLGVDIGPILDSVVDDADDGASDGDIT